MTGPAGMPMPGRQRKRPMPSDLVVPDMRRIRQADAALLRQIGEEVGHLSICSDPDRREKWRLDLGDCWLPYAGSAAKPETAPAAAARICMLAEMADGGGPLGMLTLHPKPWAERWMREHALGPAWELRSLFSLWLEIRGEALQ